MLQDPIADMLTRIRNANALGNPSLEMPSSRMKAGIAKILMDEGFISSYYVYEDVKKVLPFFVFKLLKLRDSDVSKDIDVFPILRCCGTKLST